MQTLILLFQMLLALHPRAPETHSAFDVALAANQVVDAGDPAFGSPAMDVAVLLVTAWRESHFNARAVGDGGDSLGAWQLQRVGPGLAFDLAASTPVAYQRLREAARQCPSAPLAPYVGGCWSRRARLESDLRMATARRVVEEAGAR